MLRRDKDVALPTKTGGRPWPTQIDGDAGYLKGSIVVLFHHTPFNGTDAHTVQ